MKKIISNGKFGVYLLLLIFFTFHIGQNQFISSEQDQNQPNVDVTTKCMIENCSECKQSMPYTCSVCKPSKLCCSPNCKTCSNNDFTTCAQCQSGFSYNSTSKTCQMNNQCSQYNCSICSKDGQKCEQCQFGTTTNPYTRVCMPCPVQCLYCDYLLDCTACYPGKYVDNGICLKCDDNCKSCQQRKDHCTICENGKYLVKQNHTCAKCMSKCTFCNSTLQCIQCNMGYFFNNKSAKCQPCGQYCLVCVSVAQCQLCAGGFILNQTTKFCNTCDQVIPNCMTCVNNALDNFRHDLNIFNKQVKANDTVCQKCKLRFFKLDTKLCVACTPNCLKCTNLTQCVQCDSGYVINPVSKTCDMCNLTNCLICRNSKECKFCVSGYFWNNITYPAFPYCEKCRIGCITCGINYCLSCAKQFYLANNTCLRCNSECFACLGRADNCLSCNPGYYTLMNAYRCFPCPSKCAKCKNQSECDQCILGYRLKDYQCIKCDSANCGMCSMNMTNKGAEYCLQCLTSFYLKDKQCYNCIQGCRICQDANTCQVCLQRYYADNIENKSYTCKACPQHCLQCQFSNLLRVECMKCDQSYYINGLKSCSKCTDSKCLKCADNICYGCVYGHYIDSKNNCYPCQQNCTQCVDKQTCISCSMGFYLTNNFSCQKCQDGCLYCNVNGSCLVCADGYWLENQSGSCKSCNISNCSLCSNSGESCDKCYQGFTLQNVTQLDQNSNSSSLCFKCGEQSLLGCSECQSSTKCSQCIDGYEINENNLCKKQSATIWPLILSICLLSLALIAILVFKLKKKINGKSLYDVLSINKKNADPQNYHRLEQISLN